MCYDCIKENVTKEYKEKFSAQLKGMWKCPEYRKRRERLIADFYKERNRPWLTPVGMKCESTWLLAPIIKFCRDFKKPLSRNKIVKWFGVTDKPCQNAIRLIDNGWDPLTDSKWVEKFMDRFTNIENDPVIIDKLIFLENDVLLRPWDSPRPTKTGHLWKFAQHMYEYKKSTGRGYSRYSNEYHDGKYQGVFQSMSQLIDDGFVPSEDRIWSRDFG